MSQEYFQSEIHRLLKLGPDLSKPYQPPVQQASEAAVDPGLPFNLPFVNKEVQIPDFNSSQKQQPAQAQKPEPSAQQQQTAPQVLAGMESVVAQVKTKSGNWSSILVYPAVFAVAFAFFYVALNFGALFQQVQGWFAKSEDEQILQGDLTEYNQWIQGYFFSVKDTEKLGPNNDVDGDGLSNYDEFVIKTNPTVADSDNDGTRDGIEVINSSNPWGSGQLTNKQKDTISKLDLIKINNRISFNAAAKLPALGQHTANFDVTKPGRLSIPKLNLQVPVIWTEDPADFDNDLTRGVVHYPGTALPGERGMVYISGHSSDYFWKKHPYKQVFAKLNALQPGDDIFIDVYGNDGKTYNYRYRVSSESIYAPDDQRQFIDNSGAKLNLSTCWPIGTQKDRYVVTAELQNL